jgi:hypothetical protein
VTVIASITREKAMLTQALQGIILSEYECRALPKRMRELEDRLFDFSVELSEAPECDLATMDEVAKMQEAVTAALSAFRLDESGEKGRSILFLLRSHFYSHHLQMCYQESCPLP